MEINSDILWQGNVKSHLLWVKTKRFISPWTRCKELVRRLSHVLLSSFTWRRSLRTWCMLLLRSHLLHENIKQWSLFGCKISLKMKVSLPRTVRECFMSLFFNRGTSLRMIYEERLSVKWEGIESKFSSDVYIFFFSDIPQVSLSQ